MALGVVAALGEECHSRLNTASGILLFSLFGA
jgi:hypothetical protein